MQKISDVMTRDVRTVSPKDTVRQAARLMLDLDVGVLPVCEGERLVGMVTDRDITVRSTALGHAPDECPVGEVMTRDPHACGQDERVDEVLRTMADSRVRRVPVVDHLGTLVGIVSLGDLATEGGKGVKKALKEISAPAEDRAD